MSLKLSALGLAAAALTLAACQSPQQTVPPNTLVALKVAAAPNMNAGAADPVWAKAQPVKFSRCPTASTSPAARARPRGRSRPSTPPT